MLNLWEKYSNRSDSENTRDSCFIPVVVDSILAWGQNPRQAGAKGVVVDFQVKVIGICCNQRRNKIVFSGGGGDWMEASSAGDTKFTRSKVITVLPILHYTIDNAPIIVF